MIALGGDNPMLVRIRAIANSFWDRQSITSKCKPLKYHNPAYQDIFWGFSFLAWEAGSGEDRDDMKAAVLRTIRILRGLCSTCTPLFLTAHRSTPCSDRVLMSIQPHSPHQRSVRHEKWETVGHVLFTVHFDQ